MGHFREYASTAELLTHEVMSARESAAASPAAARARGNTNRKRLRCDKGVQAMDLESQLQEVLEKIEIAKQRTMKAETALGRTLEELQKKDTIIADLQKRKQEQIEE